MLEFNNDPNSQQNNDAAQELILYLDDIKDIFINTPSNVIADTPEFVTYFLNAVESGDCARVQSLLVDPGLINIDARDDKGMTALSAAVQNGHTQIVYLLLQYKPDLDIPFQDGYFKYFTPLTYALYKNNVELFDILVKNGASLNTKDGRSIMPIEKAVNDLRYGCLNTIANRASPEIRERVIQYCVKSNSSKALRHFFDCMPAEVKQTLFKGSTPSSDNPITLAFKKCRKICAHVLLNNGIDLIHPNNKDSEEAVILRLNHQPWHHMLQAYFNTVKSHEKTSTLTNMAADEAFRCGLKTKTPIEAFGLPIELRNVCRKAFSRINTKSKYTASVKTKEFLHDILPKPREEITTLIKEINKKKRKLKKKK